MFWLAKLRSARTGEVRETASALNTVYSRHGLGGIAFDGVQLNALSQITSTPSTSGNENDVLVSVILCAHDAEETISYSLSSIASQTHKNLEIIVIDDHGSRPLRLDHKWGQNRRVMLHRNQSNIGPYNSRNVGIEIAKGDFVAFHDADVGRIPIKSLTRLVR